MSVLELVDIFQPQRRNQNLRLFKRSLKRHYRRLLATLRRQYMLHHAISDTRRAFALNEDIVLGVLIISAVLCFSTTSILANTIYMFMLAASTISEFLGVSIALWAVLAVGVITISLVWLAAFIQNMVSFSLIEGMTRKQNRSLRKTIGKSLQQAPHTTLAWSILFTLVFGPAAAIMFTTLAVILVTDILASTALPYIIGASILALGWIIWALANYSLLPYVGLFGKHENWLTCLRQSRQLVNNKGRLFIISHHLILMVISVGLYGLALVVDHITGYNSTILFLMMAAGIAICSNAVLTMLYRKRKLARS